MPNYWTLRLSYYLASMRVLLCPFLIHRKFLKEIGELTFSLHTKTPWKDQAKLSSEEKLYCIITINLLYLFLARLSQHRYLFTKSFVIYFIIDKENVGSKHCFSLRPVYRTAYLVFELNATLPLTRALKLK